MRLIGLLAILVASPAWAGLVSRPTKTCGTTSYVAEVAAGCTTIKSSEVDADFFAIITGGVNNIETANINAAGLGTAAYANASVTAAKLAPNAVTAANIADGSITSAKIADDTIMNVDVNSAAGILGTKLAVNATLNAFQQGIAPTNNAFTAASGETVLAAATVTTRGGCVFAWNSIGLYGVALSTGSVTIRFRNITLPTLVSTTVYNVGGTVNFLTIPSLSFVECPGAGTHTYNYTGQITGAGISLETDATSAGLLTLVELS